MGEDQLGLVVVELGGLDDQVPRLRGIVEAHRFNRVKVAEGNHRPGVAPLDEALIQLLEPLEILVGLVPDVLFRAEVESEGKGLDGGDVVPLRPLLVPVNGPFLVGGILLERPEIPGQGARGFHVAFVGPLLVDVDPAVEVAVGHALVDAQAPEAALVHLPDGVKGVGVVAGLHEPLVGLLVVVAHAGAGVGAPGRVKLAELDHGGGIARLGGLVEILEAGHGVLHGAAALEIEIRHVVKSLHVAELDELLVVLPGLVVEPVLERDGREVPVVVHGEVPAEMVQQHQSPGGQHDDGDNEQFAPGGGKHRAPFFFEPGLPVVVAVGEIMPGLFPIHYFNSNLQTSPSAPRGAGAPRAEGRKHNRAAASPRVPSIIIIPCRHTLQIAYFIIKILHIIYFFTKKIPPPPGGTARPGRGAKY